MTATTPVRVLVVGDPYFTAEDFRESLAPLGDTVRVDYRQIETTARPEPRTDSERGLTEYAGDPAYVARAAAGYDALVVHGAPVSAAAVTGTGLRMVCCARGGPVNVDIAAATAAGVAVCTTPGKNARAVAELTIGFLLMATRHVAAARRHLDSSTGPESTFDGREWFGVEATALTLGLVGLGRVGRLVADLARGVGCTVLAHDPFVEGSEPGVELLELDDLLRRSDVVSLHARMTADNTGMLGAAQFAAMPPGSFLINTAREQLVDEAALLAALRTGQLAGAALDVIESRPDGARNPLLDQPTVLVTPHLGGATRETLRRGGDMVRSSLEALVRGTASPFVVNPAVLDRPSGAAVG